MNERKVWTKVFTGSGSGGGGGGGNDDGGIVVDDTGRMGDRLLMEFDDGGVAI